MAPPLELLYLLSKNHANGSDQDFIVLIDYTFMATVHRATQLSAAKGDHHNNRVTSRINDQLEVVGGILSKKQ